MSDSPPKARAIRVLLVDDHPTVRETLRRALQAYPNIEVVGEASDGDEALAQVEHLQPAVVVMDINMPRMDGITATRLIKVQYPEIAVIGLSLENKEYQLYAMKKAGACGVLPKKEMSATDLFGAIQNAVAAVQPVVIMDESPPQKQALENPQPSEMKESITETLTVEGPQTGQEKNP
jgi:DNA-binding NarL/FixJ family response regulator